MNCKQVQDLLAAYLDDQLTLSDRAEVEEHLKSCKACRGELDALKWARDALKATLASAGRAEDPPEKAWEDLKPSLVEYRPSFVFLFRRRGWRIAATVIALAIVVALVVWVLVWRG